MMKITVAIMSYRYGHLAAHAIESVLAQSKPVHEIIFVDDGVGDCAHLPSLYPSVRYVMRPNNLGIIDNFNRVLFDEVKTDRLLMLGADNALHPEAIRFMQYTTSDIVSSDIALFGTGASDFAGRVNAHDTVFGGFPIWHFHKGNIDVGNYIHGSSLYNVQKARAAGGYEKSGNENSEEDWMLWKKMLKAGATHSHLALPLLFYRRHQHNYQR